MNIVFFGTTLFARDILENLAQNHHIIAIITQPDKPFGRKKILKSPETKEYAIQANIPYFQPQTSGEIDSIVESLHDKSPIDVIVVIAYGKILSQYIVEKYLCLNLHGSILPYFRGASPLQSSIMSDYQHFGLSIIKMDSGLDSGDILALQRVQKEIVANQTLDCVFKTLVPYGVQLLMKVLEQIQSHTLNPIPQEHSRATYCKKLSKQDSYLDLDDAKMCYLRYLALHNIGTWIYYNNELLKINSILGYEDLQSYDNKGQILRIQKDRILLACKKGALWIESVTPQNKSKMNILSFLQSKGLKLNDIIA